MRFENLEPLDVVDIDGYHLEIQFISDSGRIAFCRVLDAQGEYIPTDSEYEASGFVTFALTDIRYNAHYRKELLKEFD